MKISINDSNNFHVFVPGQDFWMARHELQLLKKEIESSLPHGRKVKKKRPCSSISHKVSLIL